METSQIAGLILAGGRGSRMDEADKGFALLNGRPMVEHVASRFRPQVSALLISANRNLARYADYGQVVTDDPAHGTWQGPLAGVAAGLAASQHPWLATAPCDVPFVPQSLVARLAHALASPSAGPRVAVACTGGRRQPVCMLLSRDLLPDLLKYLDEGGRKVDTWQSRVGCVEVAFDDQADAFMNVNTTGELSRASRYDSQWLKS